MKPPSAAPLSAHDLQESMRCWRPIDSGRLDRVLRVDSRRGLIEAQSGTSWQALAECLQVKDVRAGQVNMPRRTIRESVAWNAAGPDGRPVVAHVESLALVTPDGQLRRVDRVGSPALFALVIGGQGLFGALYSVTLRIDLLARAFAKRLAPPASGTPASGTHRLWLLVPPERLDQFLADVKACGKEWRMPIASLEQRLIRKETETYLRWARREYAEVGIALGETRQLGGAVRATQLRRELLDAAIAHGGGFPIACTWEATRAQTESCYPQLAAFLAEQRRIDPADRMANDWSRHYRKLVGGDACAVRWGR